jgi:hypothetical protein
MTGSDTIMTGLGSPASPIAARHGALAPTQRAGEAAQAEPEFKISPSVQDWAHLSSLEKLGHALHVMTARYEALADIARTSSCSLTLQHELAVELATRSVEELILPAWQEKVQTMRALAGKKESVNDMIAVGQFEKAQVALCAVLRAAPANIHYLTLQAELYLMTDKPGEAITIARSALEKRPGAMHLHLLLARALAANGDIEEARRELTCGDGDDPVEHAILTALVESLTERKTSALSPEGQRALDFASAELSANPRGLASRLAAVYATLGDKVNTVRWMKKAVASGYDINVATVAISPGMKKYLGPEWQPIQARAEAYRIHDRACAVAPLWHDKADEELRTRKEDGVHFKGIWESRALIVRMMNLQAAQEELARMDEEGIPMPAVESALLRAQILRTPQAIQDAVESLPSAEQNSRDACRLVQLFAALGDPVKTLDWVEIAVRAPAQNGGFVDVIRSWHFDRGDGPPWAPLRSRTHHPRQ